jgi:hypothetical protein
MGNFWTFILTKNNRMLVWIAIGAVCGIAGVWTAAVYFVSHEKSVSMAQHAEELSLAQGRIAASIDPDEIRKIASNYPDLKGAADARVAQLKDAQEARNRIAASDDLSELSKMASDYPELKDTVEARIAQLEHAEVLSAAQNRIAASNDSDEIRKIASDYPDLKGPADARIAELKHADDPLTRMLTLGRKLDALPQGAIFLHAPKAMTVGDARRVEATVGINIPPEVLRKQSHPEDQSIEGMARLSSEMIATLEGPGFAISATSPEQQNVAAGFPTVWSWKIEAVQTGHQELTATLYALVPIDGQAARQRVDSYSQVIMIGVREKTIEEMFNSFVDNFDKAKAIVLTGVSLCTGILGWLGIWVSRLRKKARARSDPKPKRVRVKHPV